MAGNSFGRILRLTSYGESHGPGLGGVLDGCPAGLPLSEEDLHAYSTNFNSLIKRVDFPYFSII